MSEDGTRLPSFFNDSLQLLRPQREDRHLTEGDRAKKPPLPLPHSPARCTPHTRTPSHSPRSQPPSATEKMSKMSWRWKWKFDVFGIRHSSPDDDPHASAPPSPSVPKTQFGFLTNGATAPDISESSVNPLKSPTSVYHRSNLLATPETITPHQQHSSAAFITDSVLSKSITDATSRPTSPSHARTPDSAHCSPTSWSDFSVNLPIVDAQTNRHHQINTVPRLNVTMPSAIIHSSGFVSRSLPITIPSPSIELSALALGHTVSVSVVDPECVPIFDSTYRRPMQQSAPVIKYPGCVPPLLSTFPPPSSYLQHKPSPILTADNSTFPHIQKPVRRSASVATVITKRPSIRRNGLRRTSSITPPSVTNPLFWNSSSAGTPVIGSPATSFLSQFNTTPAISRSLPVSPNKLATDAFGNPITPLLSPPVTTLPLNYGYYTLPAVSSATTSPIIEPFSATSPSLPDAPAIPYNNANISTASNFLNNFGNNSGFTLSTIDPMSATTNEGTAFSFPQRTTSRIRTMTEPTTFDGRTSQSELGSSSRDENECWSGFWESGFMVEEGDEIEGGYVVGKPLGTGAFSSVHAATCQKTGKRYALKVVVDKSKAPLSCSTVSSLEPIRESQFGHLSSTNPDDNQHQLSSAIEHEITLWQTLHHPNLLELVDVVAAPECLFVFCELMKDGNLLQVVSEWDCIRAIDGVWQVQHLIPVLPTNMITFEKLHPAHLLVYHAPVLSLTNFLKPPSSSSSLPQPFDSTATVMNSDHYTPLSVAFGSPGSSHITSLRDESLARGLPEYLTNRVGVQILSALAYLHNTAGIVHRDIKLDNVLVRFRHRTGYAYFLSCEGSVNNPATMAPFLSTSRGHVRSATLPSRSSNLSSATRLNSGSVFDKSRKQTEVPPALVPHLLRFGFKEQAPKFPASVHDSGFQLATASHSDQQQTTTAIGSCFPTTWSLELDGQVYLLRREICRRIIDIEAKLGDFGLSEFTDVATDKFITKYNGSSPTTLHADDADDRSGAGSLEYCPPEFFAPNLSLSQVLSAFRSPTSPSNVSPSSPQHSPELTKANKDDRSIIRQYLCAADMWAFGVMLYATTCGQMPFSDEFEPRLVKKIREGKWDAESHFTAHSDAEWTHMCTEKYAQAVDLVCTYIDAPSMVVPSSRDHDYSPIGNGDISIISSDEELPRHSRDMIDSLDALMPLGTHPPSLNMSLESLPPSPPLDTYANLQRRLPSLTIDVNPTRLARTAFPVENIATRVDVSTVVDLNARDTSNLMSTGVSRGSGKSTTLISSIGILHCIPSPHSILHHIPHNGRVSPYFMSFLNGLLCSDWWKRLSATEAVSEAWIGL